MAIPFGIAILAPGSVGHAMRACPGETSCAAMRPPASITIDAGRATFRLGRDGRIRRAPAPPSAYPEAAIWFPGTDTWYMLSHHQLVVGRGHEALWRSRSRIPSRWRLGVIAAGAHAVAFQFEHKLYIAPLGHAEHAVARRELPLGWSAAGLYTYSYERRRLQLRSATGRLLKVIARRPLPDYDVAGGRLYFIRHGALMSASGGRVTRLASLKGVGLSARPWMQPLGRLIQLEDDDRLVLVRDDGSVFASTRLPLGAKRDEGLIGSIAVDPRGGAVAFAAGSSQSAKPATGTESVYLLRAGARAATAVHVERGSFGGCARWVNVQWHGNWLLYNATEGYLAVIDSTGHHAAVDLTGSVRRRHVTRDGFSAYWTGQPPS